MKYGTCIRRVREQRGMPLRYLATLVGTTPHYLGLLELNEREPSLPMLEAIAAGLRLPLPLLLLAETCAADFEGLPEPEVLAFLAVTRALLAQVRP